MHDRPACIDTDDMNSTVKYISIPVFIIHLMMAGCTYSIITIDENESLNIRQHNDTCSTFWGAIKHLDLYCSLPAVAKDEEEFLTGMRKYVRGQQNDADSIFTHLLSSSQNSLIKRNAREVLIVLKTEQADWDGLCELYGSLKEEPSGMSRALQRSKKETYCLPETPETLSVQVNSTGVPVVDVMINGKRKKFWLDTGASEISIASGVAKECGIAAIDTMKENVITATTSIMASVGVVHEMSIGRYSLRNVPAIIVEDVYMEKKIFGLIEKYTIDGIIGWRALKNIRCTFDLPNGKVIVEQPRINRETKNNFQWCEYPLLLLRTSSGDTAKFFFDSGAKNSSAHPDIIERIPELERSSRMISYQGIGGSKKMIGEAIDELTMYSQNLRITFNALPVMSTGSPKFISIDGIVGNDILRKGKLLMDYPNREFMFIPFR